MRFTPFTKKIIFGAILVSALFTVFLSDFYINVEKNTSESPPQIFYLPQAKYIKPFVLGYEPLVADIIWIKTISYFADAFVKGRDFKYLEKLLYILADLDPMFEKAFIWGGSVLMYNGNWITKERIMESTRFLEHVWNNIKNQKVPYQHDREYWRIPHMIGFNYAIELKDIKSGLPFIEEVSQIPSAPSYYRTWVSTLYKKSGDEGSAVKNLERQLVVENLKTTLSQNINSALKATIVARLKLYYKDLYDKKDAEKKTEEIMEETERVKNIYLKSFSFLSPTLFFSMGAYKDFSDGRMNLIDFIYFGYQEADGLKSE